MRITINGVINLYTEDDTNDETFPAKWFIETHNL
jgi:hypothetical protein